MMKFKGHIHVHTDYSALDGLAKIEELILKAKSIGQEFIAITDHGSSSGLYDAYTLGQKYNFPVLLGEEFYYKNAGDNNKLGHIILIAKSEEGLANLYKLQDKAFDNFYYKPRLSMSILKESNLNGLVCTTACIANQVNQYILNNEDVLAIQHLYDLKQLFGDDLYIELQSSTLNDVIKCNKKLQKFCEIYGFKPILTNDVHYINKEDYKVHEVLLAIQQKKKMDDPKRWKFPVNDYWLKNQEEMEEVIKYLTPDTVCNCYKNIEEICNKCKDVKIQCGNHLPKFAETKEKEDDMLAELTMNNYTTRIKERGEQSPEFVSDLFKELNVIKTTGYSGYFLIVQEYVNWAKENGILVGDGRGSGSGSTVAYSIGITDVNPKKYDLLFERFLSVGRSPDFDCDFSDIDAVFKHLQDKYGKKNVARVGAFNRFTAKSALRKVMGVYGYSQKEMTAITKLLPTELHFSLEYALDKSKEFKEWADTHQEIIYVVSKLENTMSHFSTHAGGVIICEDLVSKLPVCIQSEDKDKLIVAYDKYIIEALGHYKFDILGLNSLLLLKNIEDNIEKIDWHSIDFNDSKVYDMLCSGNVLGVFQLSEQKDKVVEQQPKCFEDVISINALIRPGVCDWKEYLQARKSNVHSDLSFMECTHGLIVYQDQYLQLAQHYANWDIAYSDIHIRKNKDIWNDKPLREKFLSDSYEMGFSSEDMIKIWEMICTIVAGGYGFNRAHSTSYAVISFKTAYLKCYYPKEFYSAYLTANQENKDEMLKTINIMKQSGIKLLPPDINTSSDKFKPTNDGVMWSLTSIAHVGSQAMKEIEKLRPILSFEDFYKRRTPTYVKSTTIQALIKSGAFDFDNINRFELLKKCCADAKEEPIYMYEKDSLGMYISSTPFDNVNTPCFEDLPNNSYYNTVYEISNISKVFDKNNNEMAFAIGKNDKDVVKLIFFTSVWTKNKIEENKLYFIKGQKDKTSCKVQKVEVLEW